MLCTTNCRGHLEAKSMFACMLDFKLCTLCLQGSFVAKLTKSPPPAFSYSYWISPPPPPNPVGQSAPPPGPSPKVLHISRGLCSRIKASLCLNTSENNNKQCACYGKSPNSRMSCYALLLRAGRKVLHETTAANLLCA